MERLYDKLGHIRSHLLALCFCFSNLVNLFFYYLGFAFLDNPVRKLGFIAANCLFALVCVIAGLSLRKTARFSRKTLCCLLAVLLFYGISFGSSIWNFGLNGAVLRHLKYFIFFCVPAFFAGIYAARTGQKEHFFADLEALSFFALPAAVIYMNETVFDCNPFNYGRDLGILDYMTVAYALLPFLLAHMIRFIEKAPLQIPLVKREIAHPQLVRGIWIAIYWIAIIASGTRGTYVCVVGVCFLLVLSNCIHREARKRTSFLCIAVTGLLLFNIFIYAPPGMNVDRMGVVIDGLKSGELVTTDEDPAVAEHIDDLVKEAGGQQVANRPSEPEPTTPEEPADEGSIAEENLQIENRGTMYQIAIKEFLKSPVVGMGPGGWATKYGGYPHNVILELLCDTGLVGTLPMLLLILLAITNLLKGGRQDRQIRYILLFLMAYAIQANISATIWYFDPLLCALGFGLSYSWEDAAQKPAGMKQK